MNTAPHRFGRLSATLALAVAIVAGLLAALAPTASAQQLVGAQGIVSGAALQVALPAQPSAVQVIVDAPESASADGFAGITVGLRIPSGTEVFAGHVEVTLDGAYLQAATGPNTLPHCKFSSLLSSAACGPINATDQVNMSFVAIPGLTSSVKIFKFLGEGQGVTGCDIPVTITVVNLLDGNGDDLDYIEINDVIDLVAPGFSC